MSKFYIPDGIGNDYKYIVPSSNYYDLYNTNYLEPNQSYTYYRFYNNLDSDLYISMTRTTSQYNYGYIDTIQIEPDSSYIYRKDYPQILTIVFILTIGFVFLINLLTSCFKKGGVFNGLI